MSSDSNDVPLPDEAAHRDGRLIHELTVVNAQISRYVLRFLDADSGHSEPIGVDDEHALGERMADIAAGPCARAERRRASSAGPLTVDGDLDQTRQFSVDNQAEQP